MIKTEITIKNFFLYDDISEIRNRIKINKKAF